MTTWLITGASSGLGLSLAAYVLEKGDKAVLAAPSQSEMHKLTARYPDTALAISLDVTNASQRVAAVKQTEAVFDAVDILVNNAAVDFLGAVEEQDEQDYRRLFEVNYFGAVEMIRAVLPGMRSRRRGTIINVSSMDGLASLPVNGFYSSSKFALEGLTEALWQEIEPLGLRAMIVQPGSFRTGIEKRTHFSGTVIEDYSATSGAFRKTIQQLTPEMFPGDPARASIAIWDAAKSATPPHWLVLGSDAIRRIGAKLDALQKAFEVNRDTAPATDFPGAGQAVI